MDRGESEREENLQRRASIPLTRTAGPDWKPAPLMERPLMAQLGCEQLRWATVASGCAFSSGVSRQRYGAAVRSDVSD